MDGLREIEIRNYLAAMRKAYPMKCSECGHEHDADNIGLGLCLTAVIAERDQERARADAAEHLLSAYKKAKAENDERFQLAAAEQRNRADAAEATVRRLREALEKLAVHADVIKSHSRFADVELSVCSLCGERWDLNEMPAHLNSCLLALAALSPSAGDGGKACDQQSKGDQ